MDEVADNSVDLAIDSPPYWGQRVYRNQDEMELGVEQTLQEYLNNLKGFMAEKYRKLKPGGVLVTIIGETYQNGYQGVCTEVERILKLLGFLIVDVVIWNKKNQKFAPHEFRFRNTYERIIVAYKPGAEPYFKEVLEVAKTKGLKAKKTVSDGYYITSPQTCITNVITTAAFNHNELEKIDMDFKHDAPCPAEVYRIFIEAYSRVGATLLDGFLGSGTVAIGLAMARKVIGYDVDPLSVEFAIKRSEWYLQNGLDDQLKQAA